MNYLRASLESMGEGKAIQQFNYELEKVIDNCQDLNTDPNFVRVVTLKVKIKPSTDRKTASIVFQADSRIASDAPGADQIMFGRDGAFVANARQLTLDESVADIDAKAEGEEK